MAHIEKESPGLRQRTILLVEDEAVIAMAEKMTLERFGYHVLTAMSGKEAVAIVVQTPAIDLILMDIDLGSGIDDTETAAIILRDRDIPVVFLSSHTEPEIVAKTEKITSYGFIVKNSSDTVFQALIKMVFKLFESISKEKRRLSQGDDALAALRESEDRYRAIFDSSPNAILLTAPDGRILAVNSSTCRLFEQTEEEIKQKGRSGILDTSDPRLALALAERERTGKFNGELTFVRKSGAKFPGEISSIIFKDKEGNARTSMIIRDVSERKQAEAEIQRQLAEKEILLKEVHHRIKNNIASISGLLSLRLQSIANPGAAAVLQEAIGRVDSIRLLYDKMLLSEGYKEIHVKNYVESLTDAIVALFPGSAKVTIEKCIADFHLDAKRLFPLGLIINELLTNKMKYAFINRGSGRIYMSLTHVDNHVKLTIQDDGVGLPDGFDIKESKGFGLMLVKMLSQQLGGSFSIETRQGTRSTLEFNL